MWSVVRRNPLAAFLAVGLHLVLAVLLLTDVFPEKAARALPRADVVQARVVDAQRLEREVARLKQAEDKDRAQRQAAVQKEERRLEELKRKQAEEKRRLAALEKERKAQEKAEAEKKAQAEAAKKKKAEARRRAAAEKKKKAEAERKAAEKRKKEQERKRLAEEKKKKEAEARARKEAEAAKKRAEEERRAAEAKRKKEEAERKAAEAKRRKAEAEARAKAAREAELAAALAAEQEAREVDRYRAAIRQRIERKWIQPPQTGRLTCTLEVRLIPGGDVAAVRVVRSSGDAAFDRSVENAVYRAAPLPVPAGGLFEQFRTIIFEFDPSK